MNLDNQRLLEIQREKHLYSSLLEKADTISDCLEYQSRIENLELEETEILKRCKVEIWV